MQQFSTTVIFSVIVLHWSDDKKSRLKLIDTRITIKCFVVFDAVQSFAHSGLFAGVARFIDVSIYRDTFPAIRIAILFSIITVQ